MTTMKRHTPKALHMLAWLSLIAYFPIGIAFYGNVEWPLWYVITVLPVSMLPAVSLAILLPRVYDRLWP